MSFEGRSLVLIAPVPSNCFPFIYSFSNWETLSYKLKHAIKRLCEKGSSFTSPNGVLIPCTWAIYTFMHSMLFQRGVS